MRKLIQVILAFLLGIGFAYAQDVSVSGKVSDENGDALVGASVVIEGTSQGTVTDIEGNYSLSAPSSANLKFSFVGYVDQVVSIGSRTVINIQMALDVTELSEVVVTAFGVEREKKALGYSVTEVEGDDFTEAREINIANALTGKVAGVNVSNMATGPAGSSRVVIRGNASLSGNNQPLYVVNGIPMNNDNFGNAGMWGGSDEGDGTASINPDDIETITVLKGATAAALYGSRASNGVILITTKKGTKGQGIGVEFNTNYVFEEVMDLTDYQQEYGTGYTDPPATPEDAYDWGGGSSWGGKLDGSMVYQADGVQRPYKYTGSNIKKFYEMGHALTNT
ncbi:MAG: TonB-dependent receptor plug domain-containing protein, partial [Cyclobacteriaceae bacterium]|nr:TonB-dependent receptor plug domain-containing protein [Cyclobacteriaceae bacterium]